MCTPAAAAAARTARTWAYRRHSYTPARVLIYVGQLKNKTRGQRTEEDVKSFFRI